MATENPFELLNNRLDNLQNVIFDLKDQVSKIEPIEQNNRRFISTNEAASYLNLAVQTLYGLVNKQSIPYHKRGGRLYFDREELEQWILNESE